MRWKKQVSQVNEHEGWDHRLKNKFKKQKSKNRWCAQSQQQRELCIKQGNDNAKRWWSKNMFKENWRRGRIGCARWTTCVHEDDSVKSNTINSEWMRTWHSDKLSWQRSWWKGSCCVAAACCANSWNKQNQNIVKKLLAAAETVVKPSLQGIMKQTTQQPCIIFIILVHGRPGADKVLTMRPLFCVHQQTKQVKAHRKNKGQHHKDWLLEAQLAQLVFHKEQVCTCG